ncbi:hypothetical protein SDC9_208396 [bioreactor metagenome]|uniref:Uncharacterized protein n=1 Tax=bioreactor metagenome TaxID=1076179 RepID=A0A645JAG0_9ZZZZ
MGLFEPVHVAVGGVGTTLEVVPNHLQRVLLRGACLQRSLPGGGELGQWHQPVALQFGPEHAKLPLFGHLGEAVRVNLDLARRGGQRVSFGIGPELLQGDRRPQVLPEQAHLLPLVVGG